MAKGTFQIVERVTEADMKANPEQIGTLVIPKDDSLAVDPRVSILNKGASRNREDKLMLDAYLLLLIASSYLVSLAHGSNDVANTIS